jgi:hypothetical protein
VDDGAAVAEVVAVADRLGPEVVDRFGKALACVGREFRRRTATEPPTRATRTTTPMTMGYSLLPRTSVRSFFNRYLRGARERWSLRRQLCGRLVDAPGQGKARPSAARRVVVSRQWRVDGRGG